MTEKNPKEFFDRAYSHLLSGDIQMAATCFHYIIDNTQIFGAQAARIAQQRIDWYCIPLDLILTEMAQSSGPVDVQSIITSIFSSDQYTPKDIKPIISAIDDHLAKMLDCICIGEHLWVYKKVIDNLARQVAIDIAQSVALISLEEVYRQKWPEFCQIHTNFPNHRSEVALATPLRNDKVAVIADKFAVASNFLPKMLDAFYQRIDKFDAPLNVADFLLQSFPSLTISHESIKILKNYLISHLDNRFVEFTPGYFLTRLSLQFEENSFDDVFTNEYLPVSLEYLLKQHYVGFNLSELTHPIKELIENQLLNNPKLVMIGTSTWLSSSFFETYTDKAIQKLFEEEIVILDDLVIAIIPIENPQAKQLNLFKDVILAGLRANQQAIELSSIHWAHKEYITQLIDRTYTCLLETPDTTLEKILQVVLSDLGQIRLHSSFYQKFEDYLGADPRFTLNPNNQKFWRAIPKGQRDNELFHKLLSEIKIPITENDIIKHLQLTNLEYDLISDSRFQIFNVDRWGLSTWLLINDFAYEYLLSSKQHLHKNVVFGLICRQRKFHEDFAIFLPEEDPRFVQDALNRWFCCYQITQVDIENLLAELNQYGGAGRKLDLLCKKVVRLEPEFTNADEVLCSDERFINLDDLWYSRKAAFKELSHEDLEIVDLYFSELPINSPAISIKDIGLNALNWDGRLTNLSDLLIQDDRYIEKHTGFWGLTTWLFPDFDRLQRADVAIRPTSSGGDYDGGTAELPDTLTKRKRKTVINETSEIIQKRFYHTLSHLDILHGNIRISGVLKNWIGETDETILLVDNESNQAIAYIDESHTILNIRDWVQKRGLTFGDKIYIQPSTRTGSLYIRPYGTRDQRIYQEALQHQDIEALIANARSVNMTYHDLMIDVMEAFGIPLHREDIFQLVDYRRIAARNTIFEFLSLPDCPYEELRYFVSQGKGYWVFDRERKKAFDMKMKELLDENNVLIGRVAILSAHIEAEQETRASLLKMELDFQSIEKNLVEFREENIQLIKQIHTLENENTNINKIITDLNAQLNKATGTITQSEAAVKKYDEIINTYTESQQVLEEKLQSTQAEVDLLRSKNIELDNVLSQHRKLESEKEELSNQTRTKFDQQVDEFQNQVAILNEQVSELRDQLKKSEAARAAEQAQIETYKNKLENITQQASDLNMRLQVAADRFAVEKDEKETIQSLLVKVEQEFQAFKHIIAQKSSNLSSQLQSLAAQLEERNLSILALESSLSISNNERLAIMKEFESEKIQLSNEISKLNDLIETATQSNARQAKEYAFTIDRMKKLDDALATPLGKLFSRIQKINNVSPKE